MTSMLFLLLLISFIKRISGSCRPNNSELLNVLEFINEIRMCFIVSKTWSVQLPNLHLHPPAPSLNKVVLSVVNEEYSKFWLDLRRIDHSQDINQLVRLSKGAALEIVENEQSTPDFDIGGQSEARLLEPLCSSNAVFKKVYRSCMTEREGNTLECLARKVLTMQDYKGLKGEMILSSIWFLRIAQLVSIEGWYCLQLHLDDLRSDEKALNCIRKFDYDSVIPQILYLKFRLHARQVISRVTGDLKEAETVLMMKMDLEQVIQNEFRHIMSNEFKSEINVDGSLTYYGDQKKPEIRIVKEIHFITVNREKHSGRRAFLFLNDNHTPIF